jgi:hypothetical protein
MGDDDLAVGGGVILQQGRRQGQIALGDILGELFRASGDGQDGVLQGETGIIGKGTG